MYNSSKILALACISFFIIGCYSSHELTDNSELVIEAGDVQNMSLPAGTNDAEVMSILLTSNSARPIAASGIQCHAHGVLLDHLAGDVLDVRLVRDDNTSVGGVYQFGSDDTGRIFFDAPVVIQPGETIELRLIVNTTTDASNRITFDVGEFVPWQPSVTGRSLFASVVYADSGETVPFALVQGNEAIERHVLIGE